MFGIQPWQSSTFLSNHPCIKGHGASQNRCPAFRSTDQGDVDAFQVSRLSRSTRCTGGVRFWSEYIRQGFLNLLSSTLVVIDSTHHSLTESNTRSLQLEPESLCSPIALYSLCSLLSSANLQQQRRWSNVMLAPSPPMTESLPRSQLTARPSVGHRGRDF
jgi:hypothetical protein